MSENETFWAPYALRIWKGVLAVMPHPVVILLLLSPLTPVSWCMWQYDGRQGQLLSLQVILYAIYYAYFHPLAKYPGPFWGKFTGARAAYHAWIGDVHYDVWKLHEKYGSLNPNTYRNFIG